MSLLMFWNVYYVGRMGLETDLLIADTDDRQDSPASLRARKNSRIAPQSVAISQRRKYRSASSAWQSRTSAPTSVAGVDSVASDKEVTACSQATAAVDVVASMHSYAMPGCIRRPTKFTAGHTASCADDSTASNNVANAVDTVKRPVRLYHLTLSITLCSRKIVLLVVISFGCTQSNFCIDCHTFTYFCLYISVLTVHTFPFHASAEAFLTG